MVTLAADVTPEELQVFLQDTDEQLQVLDEDIIKLENEGDNPEVLQEIFRAAHTIKGSSAMVGYHKMADLTHAMESILDKLRKGTLSVNTQIANALLHSLDSLRVLRNNLTAKKEENIDVDSVIATLKELTSAEAKLAQAGKSDQETPTAVRISLDKSEYKRLQESLALSHRVHQIEMAISKESQWAAVRCLQALNELDEKGIVIASKPSRKEIEAEKVESQLILIFAGLLEEEEIRALLCTISDVENVRVGFYDPGEDGCPGEKAVEDGALNAFDVEKTVKTDRPAQSQSSGAPAERAPVEAIKAAETVRIDVERLDSLMNMIGELVVARTRMNQISRSLDLKYREDEDVVALSKTFTQVTKVIDQLQLDITVARMLPVGTVFNRFPRMVRDLAQKMGKKVDFIITGQETGIDRSVIEHIRDPLVHLLRNSVDHGIETSEKREAAGKPEKATVRLSAAHEQNFIMITVEDDGKGIDGAVIKEVALKKGLITAEAASRMSDAEAIDLIFASGVSTVEKATDVSGRGVGMDIVRKNIEAFNGVISVETKVGQGTKFVLRLPLTLATINALLVSSGNTIYAIPLVTISETLRLSPKDIKTAAQREVFSLRDRVVPLIRLNEVFDTDIEESTDAEMVHIVVARVGERMVGLSVDSLIEPQEVVVKSMGSFIGNVHGIAGATILGSGEVALILDVPSLIKSCSESMKFGGQSMN
ncbi:MAG: chemotaxis protein CheA [Dehalococcoidia bacterium]|nr:chemotaxis protein CheA [Dehalococcoidia bacterium]